MITDVKPDFDEMVTSVGGLATAFSNLHGAVFEGEATQAIIRGIGGAAKFSMGFVSTLADGLTKFVDALTALASGINKVDEGDLSWWQDVFKGVANLKLPTIGDIVVDLAFDTTLLEIQELPEKYEDVGKASIQGFIDGAESETSSAESAFVAFAAAMIRVTRQKLQAQSPSAVFNQIANDVVLGFKMGLQEDRAALMLFVSDFMDEIIFTAHLVATNAYGIGRAFSGGIEAGIRAGIAGIKAAAIEAAHAAEEAIKEHEKIHSPSKKFEWLGSMMIAGLNRGLQSTVKPPGIIGNGLEGGASGSAGSGSIIVNLNGPIVENMVVPNSAVGRRVARDISREISVMAMLKRNPA